MLILLPLGLNTLLSMLSDSLNSVELWSYVLLSFPGYLSFTICLGHLWLTLLNSFAYNLFFLSDSCNNFSLKVMTYKFSMDCVVVNLILTPLFLRLFHLWIAIFLKFFIYFFYKNIAPFNLLCKLYFLYKYFIAIIISKLLLYYIKYIIVTLEFWREGVYQVLSWNSPLLPWVLAIIDTTYYEPLCIMSLLHWFYF